MLIQNRNIQFTRLIKTDGRLREFNFRKINGGLQGELFTVDVSDDRGNRIMFKLFKDGTGWAILPEHSLPEWVTGSVSKFNDVIEEELRIS